MHLFDSVTEFVTTHAASPLAYLILLAVATLDGFFPPIPSETVLVTLASLAGTVGRPFWFLLIPIAAIGAIAGDNIAYQIGHTVGTDRFAWMRKPKVARMFEWARHALDTRGAVIILVARYIPIGRIAVNMTAGATGYPRRRFVPLTVLGGVTWATYSVAMGYFVGEQFENNPLLGAGVSIVVAIVMGFAVDHLTQRFQGPGSQGADSAAENGRANGDPDPDGPQGRTDRQTSLHDDDSTRP